MNRDDISHIDDGAAWISIDNEKPTKMAKTIAPRDYLEWVYIVFVKNYSSFYKYEEPSVYYALYWWPLFFVTFPVSMWLANRKYAKRWRDVKGSAHSLVERIEAVAPELEDIRSELESLRDEEQEYFDVNEATN